MSDRIRVLLVDDHTVLREGLLAMLSDEDDILVCGEAETGAAGLRLAGELQPDVIVLDLGLPDLSGLEMIREIVGGGSSARIVILSMHSGREIVMQAIRAGAHGYVPKSAAHRDLLRAIRSVHAGNRYLDPLAATIVVEELAEQNEEWELLKQLSERELEVLRGYARGYTSREMASQLALSQKSIETYRKRATDKLGLTHRSEVIQFALRAGLLDESD